MRFEYEDTIKMKTSSSISKNVLDFIDIYKIYKNDNLTFYKVIFKKYVKKNPIISLFSIWKRIYIHINYYKKVKIIDLNIIFICKQLDQLQPGYIGWSVAYLKL
jgi:hypothetical protein